MSSWPDFYDEVCGSRRLLEGNILAHTSMVMELCRLVRHGDSVLEVGTGTGVMGWPLAQAGIRVVSLDNDPKILEMARANATLLGAEIEYVEGDGFSIPFPDDSFAVVFSGGLLEHFSDEDIDRLLTEQLRVAPLAVVVVPLEGCGGVTFGDERWMTFEQWRRLLGAFPVLRSFKYQDDWMGCFTLARGCRSA